MRKGHKQRVQVLRDHPDMARGGLHLSSPPSKQGFGWAVPCRGFTELELDYTGVIFPVKADTGTSLF